MLVPRAWRKVQIFNFRQSYTADRRYLADRKTLNILCNIGYCVIHNDIWHNFDNKTANINTKNCSLSIMLTATDQKPQKNH